MTSPRLFAGFRGRLTGTFLALAIVPLFGVALPTLWWTAQAQATASNALLGSVAESFGRETAAGVSESATALQSLAESPIVVGALLFETYEKASESLAAFRTRYPEYADVVLLQLDGRAVAESRGETLDAFVARQSEVAQAEWFRAAVGGAELRIGNPVKDPMFGPVALFSQPVRGGVDRRVIGVLLGAYGLERPARIAREERSMAGTRGYSSPRLAVAGDDGRIFFDTGSAVDDDVLGKALGDAGFASGARLDGMQLVARWDGGDTVPWRFAAQLDRGEAYATIRDLGVLVLALVLFVSVLAAAAGFLLAPRLVQPVSALSEAVVEIVQTGNLAHPMPEASDDEVGQLAGAVRRLVAHQRDVTIAMQDAIRLLGEQVSGLTAVAEQQNRAVQQQASALQETHATVAEIQQTSSIAAQKADSVLAVAKRADDIGRTGEESIEQAVGALGDARSRASDTATRILALREHTRVIQQVTSSVKDLADQSNMLALNAAVEAVRSGTQGRGFAVVAREIRFLADRSVESTTRVGTLVRDVSEAVDAAATLAERNAQRMEVSLGDTQRVGENLRELSSMVRENAGAARQIAAAVAQQNAGITQIFTAITHLTGSNEETVRSIEAVVGGATTLRDLSARLDQLSRTYRV